MLDRQLDRPALTAVAVLDRVVARLGDREHRVGALVVAHAAPRQPRADAQPDGAHHRAGSDGTSIAIVAGTSVTWTSSTAMSSSAGDAEMTLFRIASHAAPRRLLRLPGQQAAEQLDPVVDARAAPLDEAVRIGEQRRPRLEGQPLLGDRLALRPAERRRGGAVEERDGPGSRPASSSSVGGWPAEL